MAITKATASSVAPAAKGDLVVGSGTNDAAVLAVGSANQVLTVDSSTGTGLKWAAASSGNLVKVSSQTFSATNLVTFDSVFDNTYDTYYVLFEEIKSVYPYSGLLKLKWRKSSANVTGSAMTYARVHVASTGATNWTFDLATGQNEAPLFPTDNRPGGATLWITPRNSTQFPCYRGIAQVGSTQGMPTIVSGLLTSYESNIDGFSISTVSNISGIITVYGVKV